MRVYAVHVCLGYGAGLAVVAATSPTEAREVARGACKRWEHFDGRVTCDYPFKHEHHDDLDPKLLRGVTSDRKTPGVLAFDYYAE